ncbi:MAG: hypothetical protein ABI790_13075 [Betaproteobacteria bacterium]
MQLSINHRGNLYIAEPVMLYWLMAAVLAMVAIVLAMWIRAEPGAIDGQPDWYRPFALVFCALAAAGIAGWARFGKPIEFDQHRRAVVRGRRIIVPYAGIAHVELREVTMEYNQKSYRIILQRVRSRRIRLGPIPNDLDASTVAARIATAIDRPVHLVRH